MKTLAKTSFLIFVLTSFLSYAQIRPSRIGTSNNQNPIEVQMQQKAKQFNLGAVHSESASMRPTAGAGGYFLRFENGWTYYNPTTKQVYAIFGDIMKKWGELGYETGELGFPTSDEKDADKQGWKRMNTFDKGTIYWNDGRLEVVKGSTRISAISNIPNQATTSVKTIDLSKLLQKDITINRITSGTKLNKIYGATNKKPVVENNEDQNCTTTYKSLTVNDIQQDVLSKSAIGNVILGGAYNLSDFSQTGKMNIYEGNGVNPIKIMLSSARLKEGTNTIEVPNVSAVNLKSSLENILERESNGKPTQNFVKTSTEIFSSKDLKLSIGLNITGLGFNVDDSFKYDYNRKSQKYLIDYKNEAFTAEAYPSTKYFKDEALNANKEIVYVDKITYGQRILISYELEEKSTEIDNQLAVKYAGQTAEFDSNLKEKYKSVVFKILAYGTNSDATAFEVKGLENLQTAMNDFFKKAVATENRPGAFGAPISYSLKFLDGTVAVANAKIESIPIRDCVANENRPYVVQLNLNQIVGKGDAQMYGWVAVKCYNYNNELIGEINNKNEKLWNVDRTGNNTNFVYNNNETQRSFKIGKNDIVNGAYFKLIYCPREYDSTSGDDFFKLENTDESIKYDGGDYRVKKITLNDYFSQPQNLKTDGFDFSNQCSDSGDYAIFNYNIRFK